MHVYDQILQHILPLMSYIYLNSTEKRTKCICSNKYVVKGMRGNVKYLFK